MRCVLIKTKIFIFIYDFYDVSVSLLPPFGSSVLEPRFDLRVGHLERFCQGRTVDGRQVSVFVELLFELRYLTASERRSRLFPLRGRSVLVRVSDATGAEESASTTCEYNNNNNFNVINESQSMISESCRLLN